MVDENRQKQLAPSEIVTLRCRLVSRHIRDEKTINKVALGRLNVGSNRELLG